MKIAHFSDLHLGIDEKDQARTAWLLEDALRRGARHVVIAGDLLDVRPGGRSPTTHEYAIEEIDAELDEPGAAPGRD